MYSQLRKLWPGLLLLVASSAWAADFHVTVGGQTTGGGYDYPVLMFTPSTVTVNVGDTITFTNAGGTHNVDANDGSFRCANGCDGVNGGNGNPSDNAWSSTVTFGANTAGHTIGFHCDVHGSMGMTGTVTVNAASGGNGNVPITSGFTGTWYDPNQAGHGIFLEVEPNNGLLAWWFTFSPSGDQVWFGNAGSIDPTTNIGTVGAVQTQGGEWIPNFNPANVSQPPWGTLTFQFTDCNHGRVDFTSSVAGYGSGHMDLTRLTLPAGLACP